MEDISKLPVWARKRIELLEMQLKETNDKLSIFEQKKKTRVSFPHPMSLRTSLDKFYLDDRETFRFHFGDEHWNYVDVVLKKNEVQVMGGHSIIVQPWAANVVKVKMTPEDRP